MDDTIPSPIPIHRWTPSDDVVIQQLVVGQDRQGKPYVLTITSNRQKDEITTRLGQTLDPPLQIE